MRRKLGEQDQEMPSDSVWLALIAATPATIAAISSLLNGREQKRVRKELVEQNGKLSAVVGRKKRPKKSNQPGGADGNTASDPDWYQSPDV